MRGPGATLQLSNNENYYSTNKRKVTLKDVKTLDA